MTDPLDPDLTHVDAAAQVASHGLHDHVARRVDPDVLLAALPIAETSRRNGRLLAAAAVALLFVGSVAVLGDGPPSERSRLELDENGKKLPAPQAGTLTPLGPRDGRDSIQLPVAVEPNVELRDGDTVTATSPGFVPGEQVGIVQCAREAGGDTREERGGVDGCNIGTVQYATANDDGVATGRFQVQRVLTTPLTGTVDCAAEAERCLVAMGAINDYDRSGGFGVAFVGGGEPIDIPTVTLSRTDGLTDGDVVHIEGDGFEPDTLLTLNVCSADPSGCWQTGEELRLDADEVNDLGLGEMSEGGSMLHVGLLTDSQGRVSGDVPVWRFLPSTSPGSYIDCAVSSCTLRVETNGGGTAPAPPHLTFTPGGPGPRPPAVAVQPSRDIAPGDEIVVRGAGFVPGATYTVSVCAAPPDAPEAIVGCFSTSGGEEQIDEDGGFATEFRVPDPDDYGELTASTACTDRPCADAEEAGSSAAFCDGVQVVCTIRVDSYGPGESSWRPQFLPAPVPVTFRGV